MPESVTTQVKEKPSKAIRMIFAFDGEHVHLVSQQAVEMLQGLREQTGFCYELRDAQDHPLYRRVIHNPMQEDVEVFSDDPQQSIARRNVPNRKGVFVVVLPDTEEGRTVTLSISDTEMRIRKTQVVPQDECRFPEESVVPLSDQDRDLFLAMLDNPRAPNEALLRVVAKHRKRHG